MDTQAEAEATAVHVYPNPSKGNFSVEYPKELGKATIKIYDSKGRMVLDRKATGGRADFNDRLTPGIYSIKINNNKSLSGKKILIN